VRLGIYDSGPNNGKGGALRAQTNPFNTVGNSWNTANVITPVPLPASNSFQHCQSGERRRTSTICLPAVSAIARLSPQEHGNVPKLNNKITKKIN
jgi:hypothetical protein